LGTAVKRWNLIRAFPVKWTGPDLKATGSEVAIETLEIAHEGIEKG
jgi:phage tail-like protein